MKRLTLLLVLACSVCLTACNNQTKEELFTDGLQQANEGNPNGAIVLFKNALEKDQNFIKARFQLAKVYLSAGKYQQAENELQKVVRQNPNNDETQLELARLYNFTGKTDQAIEQAEAYLKAHPGSADAFEIIAESHLRENRIEQAKHFYGEALAADPQRTKPKLELARIALFNGDLHTSRRLVSEVLEEYPENTKALYLQAGIDARGKEQEQLLPLYQKIAELDPNDFGARYKVGFLLLSKGKIDAARAQAQELIHAFPTRSEGPRLLGIIEYHQSEYREAQTLLQRSVTMQPTLDGYYFLGLSLYKLGQLETALTHFRTCLDANPSFLQARLMTAMILLQQKRVQEAVFEAKAALKQDPGNALAHNILGSAYVTMGQTEQGLDQLNKAVSLDPQLADAHMKRGMVKLSLNKKEQGETDLLTAIEIAPNALHSREVLYFHYMRQKQYAKAISLMEEGLSGSKGDAYIYNNMAAAAFARQQPEKGVAYLQQAKNADPSIVDPVMNLASYYASQSQFERALAEYDHVLEHDPDNLRALLSAAALLELEDREQEAREYLLRAKQSDKLSGYLALAWHYMKHDQTAEALATTEDAIRTFQENLPAQELKGRILLQQEKYKEALQVFEDIKVRNPLLGAALKTQTYQSMGDISQAKQTARTLMQHQTGKAYGTHLLASLQAGEGNLDSAIATLREGLGNVPDNTRLRLDLARMFSAQRKWDEALKEYDRILRDHPENAPALFGKGSIHEQQGGLDQAEQYYRASIASDENFAPALNNLAYLLARQGKSDEALKLAIKAYKQEPNNPGILDTLGYIYVQNGDFQQAAPILEKAVVLMPGNPTILYHLALAYRGSNMPVKALRRLDKALEMGDFTEKDQAQELVQELRQLSTSMK